MKLHLKYLYKQRHFFSGLVALALLLFALAPSTAYSVEYSISCEDVSAPETCSIQGEGGFNDGLADIVQDLVTVLNDNGGITDICVAGPGTDQYLCDIGEGDTPLQLDCIADVNANNASCNISGLSEAFFSMDCASEGAGGQCSVVSDAQAIEAEIATLGISSAVQSFASNLLAGCGALGGTDAFRNDCDALLSALAADNEEAVIEVLDRVIPANSDNAIDGTYYIVGAQLNHVRNRLSRLRQGSTGTDISALKFFDGHQWLSTGELVAANHGGSTHDTMNDVSPPATSSAFSRAGFFIDGSLILSDQDASDKENASDVTSQLITLGIDYRYRDDLIGGLAFSFASTTTDYDGDRGELDNLGFLLMAYGTYYRGNWYLDASLGIGGDDYEQTRRLVCDASCVQAFDQTAESKFNGKQTTMMLSTGYNWSRQAWTVSPFVQLANVKVDIDKYRETMSDPTGPGAGFALDIDDQSKDSLTASVGSQVSYALSRDWGVFLPYFNVQLYKEFEDDEFFVQGRFVGNVGVDDNFMLVSNDVDSSYFVVGVGSVFQYQSGNMAFVDIKSLQGNDNVDQIQFTGGWRLEF